MELSAFPDDASSDGIHFDRPRGVEWLNDVFQRHISALEAELLETAQVTFGPTPNPPFFNSRALSSRLGAMADSRDSSRNSRTKLEDLECRLELAKALGLEQVSHEDLGRLQCVDWLKAHETHFSRAKMTETADLTGIPTKSVMGPINYRPLKSLGSPGLVVEPPKTEPALPGLGWPLQHS